MKTKVIKEKFITRTIPVNSCFCMFVDLDTHSVEETIIEIAGTYSYDELEILIKRNHTPNGKIFVAIRNLEKIEQLFRISEQDFIRTGEKVVKN